MFSVYDHCREEQTAEQYVISAQQQIIQELTAENEYLRKMNGAIMISVTSRGIEKEEEQ